MNGPAPTRRLQAVGVVLAASLLLGAVGLFFADIASATSDATGGDAAWVRQVFHNTAFGRPFQMSVYHNNLGGVRRNPHAYSNSLALHFNLTPLLVAPLYRLMPTTEGLFALVLLLNYGGVAFWMRRSLAARRAPSESAALAMIGLLLWCGFFWTICEKNHFPLFSGPFVFALHHFRATRGPAFWICLMLCLGVSEDTAMFMACYGAFLFVFESENRGRGAAVAAAACAWVLMVMWLQGSLLRRGMELSAASNITGQLTVFLSTDFKRRTLANAMELLRALTALAPLLAFDILVCEPSERRRLAWRAAGLLLLAPASHWAITLMVGGGHHWTPVVICALLAHLDLAIAAKPSSAPRGTFILLGVFAALNAFGLYYAPLKHLAKDVLLPAALGYPAPRTKDHSAHNLRIVRYLAEVPKNVHLTVWVDRPIEAFAADRPHLWVFPSFFDRADLLVIDKAMSDTRYPEEPFDHSVNDAILSPLTEGGVIPRRRRADLVRTLIASGTHRLANDDPDKWVLEKIVKADFQEPPSSLGFGFLAR